MNIKHTKIYSFFLCRNYPNSLRRLPPYFGMLYAKVYVASVKMMDKDLKIGASYLFADDIGWIPNRQFE